MPSAPARADAELVEKVLTIAAAGSPPTDASALPWDSDHPCFGCLLSQVNGTEVLCQGAASPLHSSKVGCVKSPGRGLCTLWDSQLPVVIATAHSTYVIRSSPFSGHAYSQMFRRFSGLRAYHEIRIARSWDETGHEAKPGMTTWQSTCQWLVVVFSGDAERDKWLSRDGVRELLTLNDLIPMALWASHHAAGVGLHRPDSGHLQLETADPNPCVLSRLQTGTSQDSQPARGHDYTSCPDEVLVERYWHGDTVVRESELEGQPETP